MSEYQPSATPHGSDASTSLDRLFPGPVRRISLFWRLQLLGWGGFGLVSYYAFSVYFEVYTPGELAFYEATRMAMACPEREVPLLVGVLDLGPRGAFTQHPPASVP